MTGPLAGFESAFREELEHTGYTPSSVVGVVATMARLSSWMGRNDITVGALSPAVLDALPMRLRGTGPVVGFLRDCGAIPWAPAPTGW